MIKKKRGASGIAPPQGVDLVFEFEQKGFHAPLMTLLSRSKTKSKAKIGAFDLKSKPWGQSLKPPFFF
ncbi:MAG: hypothetical protein HQL89_01390 [Magnetococcales bacterium]|nr:hypothetical protein [Magnetococcales bacterium]